MREGHQSFFIPLPTLKRWIVYHAFFICSKVSPMAMRNAYGVLTVCKRLGHLPYQLGLLTCAFLSVSSWTSMRTTSGDLCSPTDGPRCYWAICS